jgi:hypothetical protein
MQSAFWFIMAFYAIVSCFIFPFAGYLITGGSNKGMEYGYLLGTSVTVFLWFAMGRRILRF